MIQQSAQEAILQWARNYPLVEVTGFVEQLETRQIVVPMKNVALTPTTDYRWDPAEMAQAFDTMDVEGGKPVAYYHSHPNGRREPSETDMRAALQPGMLYLIAYPDDAGVWRLSAWDCLEEGILLEATL